MRRRAAAAARPCRGGVAARVVGRVPRRRARAGGRRWPRARRRRRADVRRLCRRGRGRGQGLKILRLERFYRIGIWSWKHSSNNLL